MANANAPSYTPEIDGGIVTPEEWNDVRSRPGRRWPLTPPGVSDGTPIFAPAAAAPAPVRLPADARFLPHVALSGAVDGVNTVYLSPVPFISGDIVREVVYRNGVRVDPADYTADPASRTITFLRAPLPADTLLLDAYVEIPR